VLYFEKHLADRIVAAMRMRQSSMVLYVFSCDRPEEMSWHLIKPAAKDDELWFPVERQRLSEVSRECLISTGKHGGYALDARFRCLLEWIRNQGLGFYLTNQCALVCYWHPGTGSVESTKKQELYDNYVQRLTQLPQRDDLRVRIKRAMDAGQNMASVQILYSPLDFFQKTASTITEICLICHETKQVMTNATLEDDDSIQWVVNGRFKGLIEMLDRDGLRWSLRFEDVARYDWALMVASW